MSRGDRPWLLLIMTAELTSVAAEPAGEDDNEHGDLPANRGSGRWERTMGANRRGMLSRVACFLFGNHPHATALQGKQPFSAVVVVQTVALRKTCQSSRTDHIQHRPPSSSQPSWC